MKVLALGGSGEVGSLILPILSVSHEITIGDLHPPRDSRSAIPFVRSDVLDPTSIATAATGHDAVLYLAMGRKVDWNADPIWTQSQFDINVRGLDCSLEAIASVGISRVVHASSMSVFAEFPDFREGHTLSSPDATDTYGLTKRLAETVCEAWTRKSALSITSLRLSAPVSDSEWLTDRIKRPFLTAASDVADAFDRALRLSRRGYSSICISGDIAGRPIEHNQAKSLLGWTPRYSAFEVVTENP